MVTISDSLHRPSASLLQYFYRLRHPDIRLHLLAHPLPMPSASGTRLWSIRAMSGRRSSLL
ncbi:hypothetical protein BDV18DRAFT_144810 [Aspergillus unguis]